MREGERKKKAKEGEKGRDRGVFVCEKEKRKEQRCRKKTRERKRDKERKK